MLIICWLWSVSNMKCNYPIRLFSSLCYHVLLIFILNCSSVFIELPVNIFELLLWNTDSSWFILLVNSWSSTISTTFLFVIVVIFSWNGLWIYRYDHYIIWIVVIQFVYFLLYVQPFLLIFVFNCSLLFVQHSVKTSTFVFVYEYAYFRYYRFELFMRL